MKSSHLFGSWIEVVKDKALDSGGRVVGPGRQGKTEGPVSLDAASAEGVVAEPMLDSGGRVVGPSC